jgi:coiled-coil domain-containing protein 55
MSNFGLQIPQKKSEIDKSKTQFQLKLANAQRQLFNLDEPVEKSDRIDFTKKGTIKESKIITDALEEDSSIFDYDAHHVAPPTRVRQVDSKPKYMEALLASAQSRKAEQARVQERKIQKQREEEGDLGGEKFVTSAYKQLLEQTRTEEKTEKEQSKDMNSFYRNILDTMSTRPIETQIVKEPKKQDEPMTETKPTRPQELKYGLHVPSRAQVNDDGQIVDKRNLLSAGLNLSKAPPKPSLQSHSSTKPQKRTRDTRGDSKMVQDLERQHFEKLKRDEEDRQREREQVLAKVTKKADSETISEAKRRYWERKKAKEESL